METNDNGFEVLTDNAKVCVFKMKIWGAKDCILIHDRTTGDTMMSLQNMAELLGYKDVATMMQDDEFLDRLNKIKARINKFPIEGNLILLEAIRDHELL